MKLLKLEILNLASLDRPDGEVINFEEGALKDSTIFSIVGSTGSGKSTILDAICLALYNRAPRYPRKKGERNTKIEVYGDPDENEKNRVAPTDCRNIITRGTKYGYSKLTFLANNGTMYRAEWSVKFAVKKFEDVITALYSISSVNGNIVETVEEWERLPEIIGLDYDQFLRTVLIAQGTFSNFLNAKEEERYVLLEKLIGNEELYSNIASAIKKRKDDASSEYAKIAATVAAYEKNMISPDELDAVVERIKELQNEEDADKLEKSRIDEALLWYAAEKKFLEDLAQYERELLSAKQALEEHKEDAARLLMHDVTLPAVELYKDILNAKADVSGNETSMAGFKELLSNETSDLEKRQEEKKVLEDKENEAKETRNIHKPHIEKARTLQGELKALRDEETRLAKTSQTAVNATSAAQKALEDNEKAIVKLKAALQEKKAVRNNLTDAIFEKSSEFAAAAESAKNKYEEEYKKLAGLNPETLQNEKSAADKVLADLKEAVRVTKDLQEKSSQSAAKQTEQTALQGRNIDIDKALSSLCIDKLEKELEVMNKSYTLMTSENWSVHRKDLSEGKPCPLCGSVHHPYAVDENLDPVVSELGGLIAEKKAVLKAQKECKSSLEKEKGANSGKIEACVERLSELAQSIDELENAWSVLHGQYAGWQQNLEELESGIQTAQARCDLAQQRVEEYNKLTKRVEAAREDADNAVSALNKYKESSAEELRKADKEVTDADILYQKECGQTQLISEQLAARRGEQVVAEEALAQGKKQVAEKEASLKEEIGDKDPDKFEKELDDAVAKASAAVVDKADAIVKVRERMRELEGKIQQADENRKKAQEKDDARTEELNAWLTQYNAQPDVAELRVEDIAAFLSCTDDWESIRSEQKSIDTEYTRSHTTLENKKKEHQRHQQTKPEKTEEELSVRQAELAAKTNAELVEAKARMQRHDEAKAEMGQLYEVSNQAKQLKNDWEEINDAIGGDGKTLRKIAQCYTLRFLIEHANVEIRKFNSRYELMQVKNSLGIRIIDHDRADDVRDTTSLSGGETFIVSLGLALGLSALSSRNISFENLFIDEGFGTLDPDTLATVIDSLAMLQSSQGKKVGVISHTDTMSERITTQIRIIKNGNSGSSRIEIWPE